MLIEYIHPIHYELNINPLISGVVLDSFIYKQTSFFKFFKRISILFDIFDIYKLNSKNLLVSFKCCIAT